MFGINPPYPPPSKKKFPIITKIIFHRNIGLYQKDAEQIKQKYVNIRLYHFYTVDSVQCRQIFQLNPSSASVNPSSASSLLICGQSASRIGDCRGTGGDEWSVVVGGGGGSVEYM